MDFALQQRNPARHLVGLAVVIFLHVLIVYALLTGLGRKVIEVIKQPVEITIIEELKPPPPPEVKLPPPPKFVAPPPVFVPPPEVQLPTPPPEQNVIAAITETPPVERPPPVAPRVEEPKEAKPAPPPPVTVGVVCPGYKQVLMDMPLPKEAVKDGISGEVLMQFTVGPKGEVKDVGVVKSSNRIFNRNAITAVSRFTCVGQGDDAKVQVQIVFKIED